MNKAVFLDRDGTINVEKNYLYRIEDFEFLPGAIEGLRRFKQAGYLSAKNAHLLADKLKAKGVKILTDKFFNEFVIDVDNADEFLANLKEHHILGGIKLDDTKILVATTEMNSEDEIENYVKLV